MVRGEVIGCIGLTEPHAGSDLARVRTRARKITGGWKLDGVKQFITNGSTAQVAIILAVTNPDAGTRAMSFFLVPRSEEHTSEFQSLMRISYAVFCFKTKKAQTRHYDINTINTTNTNTTTTI